MILDRSFDRAMSLGGYIPVGEFGFSLPAYQPVGGVSNAWYTAISEVDGDHASNIADFDVLEGIEPTLFAFDAEVSIGDPWLDVFLWEGSPYAGRPNFILQQISILPEKIRHRALPSYLDLAISCESNEASKCALTVLDSLITNNGPIDGVEIFQDTVIKPGVLLALNRQLRRIAPTSHLPSLIREFDVRRVAEKGFIVELAKSSQIFFGEENLQSARSSIRQFGRLIGFEISVELADRIALKEVESQPSLRRRAEVRKVSRPFRSRLFGFARELGIDLGTSNTRIFARNRGLILEEPSAVALKVEGGTKIILSVGTDAALMADRTPDNIEVTRPIRDGAVADLEITIQMISAFIKKVGRQAGLFRPLDLLICVPTAATSSELRSIYNAARGVGAKEVFFIQQPMAAAIGSDIPVLEPVGSMLVNIGGGATEVAIITLKNIVFSVRVKVGGDKIDELVTSYIRRRHNLLIGSSTAEKIKKDYGIAWLDERSEGKTFYVRGRDLMNGVPREISLTQISLLEPIREGIAAILEGIRNALESVPPELAADIVDQGIVLTGGGALLNGLARYIMEETGLPVDQAQDPSSCVAIGIGRAMEDPLYRGVFVGYSKQ